MQLSLIKCAVDWHDFGRTLHDDTLDRWIKICRRCGTVKKVDAPRNEHGMNYTSHEWLDAENERTSDELDDLIKEFKRGL